MNVNKDLNCDVICQRNHVAKADRDLNRVCPSKLTKQELENLYFALLENNVELKKTVHSQRDKVKLLSTKLQRMTVMQRNAASKDRVCCTSKVVVAEQKEVISDLKRANDQMCERVRLLNMKLCSAKQFLRKSSAHSVKCPKCGICSAKLNVSSMSALNTRPSQVSVKTSSVSCQYMPMDAPSSDCRDKLKETRSVATETDMYENNSSEQCNENKCRTVMDELKQRISNLQEELSKSHTEYAHRIQKLESELSSLQEENTAVKADKMSSDHTLRHVEQRADVLKADLRQRDSTINDLTMQLAIEKRKVKELETALKLARKPSDVTGIIDKLSESFSHDTGNNQLKNDAEMVTSTCHSNKPDSLDVPLLSKSERLSSSSLKSRDLSKSDDSGCVDLNRSDIEDNKVQTNLMECMNQEMMRKISDLQSQLDILKIREAGSRQNTERILSDSEARNGKQMAVLATENYPNILENRKSFEPEKDLNTSTPVRKSLKENECGAYSTDKPEANVKLYWNDAMEDSLSNNRGKYGSDKNPIISTADSDPLNTGCVRKTDDRNDDRTTNLERLPENSNVKNAKGAYENGKGMQKVSYEMTEESLNTYFDNTDTQQVGTSLVLDQTDEDKLRSVEQPGLVRTIGDIKIRTMSIDKTAICATDEMIKRRRESTVSNSTSGSKRETTHSERDITNHSMAERSRRNSTLMAGPNVDSDAFTANLPQTCHGSDTHATDLPQARQRSDTFTTSLPQARRDSTTYIAEKPETRRNSDTYTANIPQTRRDSATYTADKEPRRNSATFTDNMPQARRDSATFTANPPQNRRDPTAFAANLPQNRRNSATFNANRHQNTYNKPNKYKRNDCGCTRSESTSPDNTEREISSLSDLPPEKDVQFYPRLHGLPATSSLSPGEERFSTVTETDTKSTEYNTLSDGEIPILTHKARKLSIGEKPEYNTPRFSQTSDGEMEATLNAITAELAHCKTLLAAARDHEVRRFDRTS